MNNKFPIPEEKTKFGDYFPIFDNINEAVRINTKEGQIFFVNKPTLDLFGYSKDKMTGMSIIDSYADPDVRPGIIKILEKNGSIKDFSARLKKKNGEIIDCEFNTKATEGNTPNGVVFILKLKKRGEINE